ncbi:hypothetical protein SCUCBS95973_009463 [Sporothrix curviconia]|uniref:Major facilitator superfamily transporter n=1 Tax=Sporothrix curviconia TaxID=1260050 RepID=A0ABP0CV53_9PEZI
MADGSVPSKTGNVALMTEHVDSAGSAAGSAAANGEDSLAPGSAYRIKVERSLVRKLDAKMFLLVIIYILNYIDRNNASAARLEGFQSDLNMTDTDFATNRIGRPSLYLPACMVAWGLISTLTGVVNYFSGAVACRFFIGLVEAAFSPGSFFLLSACLMAAGILARMEGIPGHRAWRWLFFIEGAITIAIAFIAIFTLPDFPHNTTRHLSPDEQRVAQLCMREDTGEVDVDSSEEKWYHGAKLAFADWKMYFLAVSQTAMIAGTPFSTYFPSLTKTLGYGNTQTLLLSAPPWIFACIVALANTWHADRVGERYLHHAWPLGLGIVGPQISAPATRRSFSWPRRTPATFGAIAGSYIWPSTYGPSFRKPFGITTAMYGLTILLNLVFRQSLVAANKKLASGEAQAYEDHTDLAKLDAKLDNVAGPAAGHSEVARREFRYML